MPEYLADLSEEEMKRCASLGCEGPNHTVTCPLFERKGDAEEEKALKKKLAELDGHAGLEEDLGVIGPPEEEIIKIDEEGKVHLPDGMKRPIFGERCFPESEESALKKWEESVRVALKRGGFSDKKVAEMIRAHKEVVKEIDDDKELKKRFTYHAPNLGQQQRYIRLRDYAKNFAELVMEYCPESRERSLALTKIEEAVMWANAAIARRE